ncbi:TPA: flagellar biosynthesis protein FliQ [Candidatus Poribacteria bacterium]|nr:flagellar biosynthesis protein FliQ [Candidatus Poribacteria bacterium]
MSIELVNHIIKQALITVLLASAPALVIGLLVGLVISVFQAVSQIHEVTLAFIPKIVAIFLSLIIFGPWIISVIIQFAINLWANLSNYGTM